MTQTSAAGVTILATHRNARTMIYVRVTRAIHRARTMVVVTTAAVVAGPVILAMMVITAPTIQDNVTINDPGNRQ
jgi:hypothetical protein